MVYSARRFVVCLTLCHFVLVFFSHFNIAISSLGEERANLSAFRSFVGFVLVWICRFYRFPLPLGVWEGLRFVTVALPGLFSYPFFFALKIYLTFISILTFRKSKSIIFYPALNTFRHCILYKKNSSYCCIKCKYVCIYK